MIKDVHWKATFSKPLRDVSNTDHGINMAICWPKISHSNNVKPPLYKLFSTAVDTNMYHAWSIRCGSPDRSGRQFKVLMGGFWAVFVLFRQHTLSHCSVMRQSYVVLMLWLMYGTLLPTYCISVRFDIENGRLTPLICFATPCWSCLYQIWTLSCCTYN